MENQKLADGMSFGRPFRGRKKVSPHSCLCVAFPINKINKVNKVHFVKVKCNILTIIEGYKIEGPKSAHKISFGGLYSGRKKVSPHSCLCVAFPINKINKVNKVHFVKVKCNILTIIEGYKIEGPKSAHKISFGGLYSGRKKVSPHSCLCVAFLINNMNKVNKVHFVKVKCNVLTIIEGYKIEGPKSAHKISFGGLYSGRKKVPPHNCRDVAFLINNMNNVNKVHFVKVKCNVLTIIEGYKIKNQRLANETQWENLKAKNYRRI